MDTRSVDDLPSVRFKWTINNFSTLNTKKLYSEVFYAGGYKWRVLIFPKGNNVNHLSMYLAVADSDSATLPYGWSRYAQFSLVVINQIHDKFTVYKDAKHEFNAKESDWGFTSFMPLSDLHDPIRGYLVDDTCIVEADIAVGSFVDYGSHDYIGLKNQGATCYMNSLLQILYHIPYFREAVYHMPTNENDMPSGSTLLATKELTKSFGWDTSDSFKQHSIQDLNRFLCEKLEEKMKGTVVEGTILQQLFEGHHTNYIECINVDFKSTRKESFYDLQLDVKGCRDVYASFDKYVEVEWLEGDNGYHAEQHGLQDARKGVLFINFPPILQLQLKRFKCDSIDDTMVKINDRYEFPFQLDLDRENGKYLSPEADRSVCNLYTLHSVLVHSGGLHGGHYYAYIRPTLSDQWFKFDEESVTKEDVKRVLEEQYGGEEELPQTNPGLNNSSFKFTKYSNAYMLVYIRESDKEKIICDVDEKDIAAHPRIRLKKEQEEKEQKTKEKAEDMVADKNDAREIEQERDLPVKDVEEEVHEATMGEFEERLVEKDNEYPMATVIVPETVDKGTSSHRENPVETGVPPKVALPTQPPPSTPLKSPLISTFPSPQAVNIPLTVSDPQSIKDLDSVFASISHFLSESETSTSDIHPPSTSNPEVEQEKMKIKALLSQDLPSVVASGQIEDLSSAIDVLTRASRLTPGLSKELQNLNEDLPMMIKKYASVLVSLEAPSRVPSKEDLEKDLRGEMDDYKIKRELLYQVSGEEKMAIELLAQLQAKLAKLQQDKESLVGEMKVMTSSMTSKTHALKSIHQEIAQAAAEAEAAEADKSRLLNAWSYYQNMNLDNL